MPKQKPRGNIPGIFARPNRVDGELSDSRLFAPELDSLDKLRTLGEAAALSGLKYHVIQRAAKRGLLKTYSLGSSKKYVTLRDIFEASSSKT